MNRMYSRYLVLALLVLAVSGIEAASDAKLLEQYQKQYPFFEMKDTVYTFEGEFTLPAGFSYPDDKKLSEYSAWISHFPIWHKTKQVGSWEGGKAMEYDQVSRVVHFPWRGPTFTDLGFMVRILFDYYHAKGMEEKLVYTPASGDACSYPQYLKSKMVYNNRGAVVWQPATERPASLEEYYKFLANSQSNTTYAGLTLNCEKVPPADVQPGDLFVAHDESGRKGVVYIMMNMIENKSGEKRFAAATGCKNACDFHIALLSDNRDIPWVPLSKIESLAPADAKIAGFFRFKLK